MYEDLLIGDFGTWQTSRVQEAITKFEVSYTMDSVSQISFEVWDQDWNMINSNYFLPRRAVIYRGRAFEMTSIEYMQGPGGSPVVRVEARSVECQLMKRDKDPEAYGGISATDYAMLVAERYNLRFYGQPTSTKRVIAKGSNDSSDTSVWDVLKNLASEAQFVLFEQDRSLFFGSQEWLLDLREPIPLGPPGILGNPNYPLLEIPNCRRSEDDPLMAEFRALMPKSENSMALRAGMVVSLNLINGFEGRYLITEVSYEDSTPDPVSISCRTPEKPKEKK